MRTTRVTLVLPGHEGVFSIVAQHPPVGPGLGLEEQITELPGQVVPGLEDARN